LLSSSNLEHDHTYGSASSLDSTNPTDLSKVLFLLYCNNYYYDTSSSALENQSITTPDALFFYTVIRPLSSAVPHVICIGDLPGCHNTKDRLCSPLLDGWSTRATDLTHTIASFDRPAELDDLAAQAVGGSCALHRKLFTSTHKRQLLFFAVYHCTERPP
jgi:hypothetical protein